MKKKSQFLLCRKKEKKKKKIRRRQRKTPPSYIEQRKKYPREYRKHTEIITKNITVNNLPTPNRFCFSVEKKQ